MNFASIGQLPKEKKQHLILIGILTVAGVIGTLQFFVMKQWNARGVARDKAAALTHQIEEAEKRAKYAAANEEHRKMVREFAATQQANMVTGDPFAWVVREVTLLAENHPVRVTGLRPGSKGEPDERLKCATYLTRLEITGRYDDIGNFVRDLENRFPTAEIQSLTLAGNPSGQHSAALDLKFLVLPEKLAKKTEAKDS